MNGHDLDVPEFLDRRLTEAQKSRAWKKFKAPKLSKREPTDEERRWADYERRKAEGRAKDLANAEALKAEVEQPKAERQQAKFAKLREEKPRERSANAEMRAKLLSVKALAKELGLHPRVARTALRKAKFAKPAWGWAFTDEMAAQARKIIPEQLKKDEKQRAKKAKEKTKKKAKRGK